MFFSLSPFFPLTLKINKNLKKQNKADEGQLRDSVANRPVLKELLSKVLQTERTEPEENANIKNKRTEMVNVGGHSRPSALQAPEIWGRLKTEGVP